METECHTLNKTTPGGIEHIVCLFACVCVDDEPSRVKAVRAHQVETAQVVRLCPHVVLHLEIVVLAEQLQELHEF